MHAALYEVHFAIYLLRLSRYIVNLKLFSSYNG